MNNTTTIIGLTATNSEWTAWSAVGTIAAALIALFLPAYVNGRAKREAERERARRYHEVASATYNAIDVFNEAVGALKGGVHFSTASAIAARASLKADSLRILAKLPGLGDGVIECAVGAAQVLERVVKAEQLARASQSSSAVAEMAAATVIAQEVYDRADKVVKYNQIPVRAGRTLPTRP